MTQTAAMVRNPKLWWTLVFLLALAQIFIGLDSTPLIDRDEGEYATVSMEMIERSDWVIPHVNGRQYYEKPALYFWMVAASFKAFGYNEFAARLPGALTGLLLIGLMGWFARRRGGDLLGLLTALVTSTAFMVILLARVALLDAPLTLLTTATLFFFYEGYIGPDQARNRWWFWAAWIFMGLSFLEKGPIGAIIPLWAVFFLTVFNRDVFRSIWRCRPITGILLFIITAAPWYILAFMREGRNFWEGFFIAQNVGRFTDVVLGHGAPIYGYIPVLMIMLWPWFFFALPASRKAWKEARTARKAREKARFDYFLLAWFISSLIVFSLAATKQPNYVMPTVPAVLLLTARWWQDRFTGTDQGRPRWTLGLTAFIGVILAVFLCVVAGFFPEALEQARAGVNPDSFEYAFPDHVPELGFGTPLMGVLIGLCALAGLFWGLAGKHKASLAALTVGAVFFTSGLFHLTAPPMMDYLQTPSKEMGLKVREEMKSAEQLGAFGLYKPTLWFYTQNHIYRVRSKETDKLREYLARPGRRLLLSRKSLLPVLSAQPDFRLIEIKGGYVWGDNRGRAEKPEGGG